VLDRHDLAKQRCGPRDRARRARCRKLPRTISDAPTSRANSGSAMAATGDGRYDVPLLVSDQASHSLFLSEALDVAQTRIDKAVA